MTVGVFRRLNLILAYLPQKTRLSVYRLLGMSVGHQSQIAPGLRLDDPSKISIGDNCFLNHNIGMFTGIGDATITIGDRVSIGMDTILLCPTHELGPPRQRAGRSVYRSIHIHSGCWIGAKVMVLPGVTIEEGVVVAAGSVVTQNCIANHLYAGNPAKAVRPL